MRLFVKISLAHLVSIGSRNCRSAEKSADINRKSQFSFPFINWSNTDFNWCKRKEMYLLQDIIFTELGFIKHDRVVIRILNPRVPNSYFAIKSRPQTAFLVWFEAFFLKLMGTKRHVVKIDGCQAPVELVLTASLRELIQL